MHKLSTVAKAFVRAYLKALSIYGIFDILQILPEPYLLVLAINEQAKKTKRKVEFFWENFQNQLSTLGLFTKEIL